MSSVLVVDDEESICWSLSRALSDEGHRVRVASSAEEAFRRVTAEAPDLVILDVRLPGLDGLSAMSHLKQLAPAAQILIMTAFGDLETAVTAFGNGAADYVHKPFELDAIITLVQGLLAAKKAQANAAVAQAAVATASEDRLIGASPAMQEVFRRIALVATSDSPVLITGESGTGKELAALAIYSHSRRRSAPFVPINLAALSPGLVESELFGHLQGAFTGADRDRTGLLELADGGTVFFDEVADVPLALQVKLLRVIEQQELTRVGSTQPRKNSFRVVAATNRDLRQEIHAGRFREDLYFRLAVFQLHLPPLRERAADIELLAMHFLIQFGRPEQLSPAAMDELGRRWWPGNVREFRNAIESAVILARGGPITAAHFPPSLLDARPTDNLSVDQEFSQLVDRWAKNLLEDSPDVGDLYQRLMTLVEQPLLRAALEHCKGNRLQAAKLLGLNRTTVRKKLGGQDQTSLD
jgi:two-component system nitrogen regulation response regulator GlnG